MDITKKEIKDKKEINYEDHISDIYNTIFKENTFKYLIDSNEMNISYLDNLKDYIDQSCDLYNDNKENIIKAYSAMQLEDYYNIEYGSSNDKLESFQNCDGDYESVINELNQLLNSEISISDEDNNENEKIARNLINIIEKISIYQIIELYKLDKNENEPSLRKRYSYLSKRDRDSIRINTIKAYVNNYFSSNNGMKEINSLINSLHSKKSYENIISKVVDEASTVSKDLLPEIKDYSNFQSIVISVASDITKKLLVKAVDKYTEFTDKQLKKIKTYGMHLNRAPEIQLIDSLHNIQNKIKEKYKNFEISENFGFKSYHSEELGDDKDFNIDVDFKIPEKIIVQSTSVSKVAGTFTDNAINDNLSTMKSYTDTLNNLIKNYIVKKYKNKISIKKDFNEMKNELEQIGKKRIIAINNPMVYGKNIQRFFNINDNQIEYDKLSLEQQYRIIDAIMDPVDSKKIAMKAINEIARKITIENSESNNQNSDNSELNKSKIILQVNLPQGKELNRQDTDLEGKELSEEDITEIMKEVDNIDKNVIGSFYGFEFKNEKDEYIDLHFDYLPNYSWTYSFNEESVEIEENYEKNQKENGKIYNLKEKARKNVKCNKNGTNKKRDETKVGKCKNGNDVRDQIKEEINSNVNSIINKPTNTNPNNKQNNKTRTKTIHKPKPTH